MAELTPVGKVYKQIGDFKDKIIGILQQLDNCGIVDTNGQVVNIQKEVREVEKYYDKLMMVKKVNSKMPLELLYEYGIKVYPKQILTKDEEFFLGQVDTIVNDQTLQQQCDIEQKDVLFIRQIKLIWDHLKKNNQTQIQNNIWQYVQVICILTERALGKNILSETKTKLG